MKAIDLLKLRFIGSNTVVHKKEEIVLSPLKYYTLALNRVLFLVTIPLSPLIMSSIMKISTNNNIYPGMMVISIIVGPVIYFIILTILTKLNLINIK